MNVRNKDYKENTMGKKITLQDFEQRLTALEREVAFLHLGAKKVGHSAPVKAEKPIDFSSIGGVCIRKASDQLNRKSPKNG